MKKKNVVLCVCVILLIFFIVTLVFSKKYKVRNFDDYSIIDLNRGIKSTYLLFEDKDYYYYIKGNPFNMYYVTGATDLIDDETYNDIKNGKYNDKDSKCVTINSNFRCYYITNLVKHVYMNLSLPENIENIYKITKKERKDVSLNMTDYELGETYNGRYEYYKDYNGRKLFIKGYNDYKVMNINKYYKLSILLENNNISLDDLYTSMRYGEYSVTPYYEVYNDTNIDCLLYKNAEMKICRYFDNNELYYEIEKYRD
ncbi:MAG: hypothetical protein IJ565_03355 [Bacilli bacterium]|nr:hypothetical protein [Bacilli bacterium]